MLCLFSIYVCQNRQEYQQVMAYFPSLPDKFRYSTSSTGEQGGHPPVGGLLIRSNFFFARVKYFHVITVYNV